ncbi:MAG: nickel ABC transporter ATP-binding protein NikE [Pseudonocardiaceae bacterium]
MTERTATLPPAEPVRTEDRLLDVESLVVTQTATGRRIVDGIDFHLRQGESVALVGESGSGKSLTSRALMALLPLGLASSGRMRLGEVELSTTNERQMIGLRGQRIGLLMQDPFTMLNPLTTAATHLAETLRSRSDGGPAGRSAMDADISRRLEEVGIVDPAAGHKYPFELSGGMRQRIALAAALAKDPQLLIADEPTTALDTTTQRDVLRLLRRIQRERQMGLLLITHDLKVAFSLCERIMVMNAGKIVETAEAETLRDSPQDDYTARLLAADLALDIDDTADNGRAVRQGDLGAAVLLKVSALTKQFGQRRMRKTVEVPAALEEVDMTVTEGRSVGLVGESGSGKSTLARCVLGLEQPTSGSIRIDDLELGDYTALSRAERRQARQAVQCVFQDPYSTLNPSHSIGFTLTEAVRHRKGRASTPEETEQEIAQLLTQVGLPPDVLGRRPAAFSGGQRQRIAIARALAMKPRLLICDEALSALDVSVQAQVLEVLEGVKANGVTLLFITHDLAVARHITDDLVVLHRGHVVETGPTGQVLTNPQQDYTRRLLAAVPTGEPAWLT